ncbi:magnesium transporter [Labrenzia sp. C1B10]|jgi:magnesium transporter|uniref:magnesium transporter CorA family protein n=1 Tax=unclassified Labrenzia TaxID=2648686 RepID=UPI0003B84D6D|nr:MULTISPECIES: magnesium transporter CorA family protein [unclassified Labrenzia]ERP88426.1 magnesium transporter [Labrenzia sp. C1B10]ERP99629.1 magnesium transporter [Labrenzia sp. C1B70]QFT01293.1 Magnesium transport protein CorA [Labrenzia sp. THAF191b]QFT07606.1 Magnesium transport protein CorA [Labrenzia sp. THAF191a]QFT19150.1 Magnesium transport protein CorA [Labrenzia sp. THAF187b]
MIIAYCPTVKGLERLELASGAPLPTTSVWIDLVAPTQEEQKAAEKLMGAEIPTRDEIASIETSERLYLEPGAVVMTAQLPIATQMIDPALSSVTFVVNAKRLVTVRYGEPKSIALLSRKVQADSTIAHKGPAVLFTMLDIIVDRCADEMESASARYDKLAVQVFGDGLNMRKTASYQIAIKQLGQIGLHVSKMHDVCTSLSRMMLYLSTHAKRLNLNEEQEADCKMFGRDIHSIKEHGDALDNKLSFLLDATVGLVTLEQNQISKIFTVVSVIFLPPTLIASIYGMNFANMPELNWQLGFLFSLGLMVSSVGLTFLFFRWKRLL